MKLPPNDVKTIVLGEGEDLVTPAVKRDGGAAIYTLNYEVAVDGGYRRVEGYERLDGQTAPSAGGTRGDILAVPGSGGILGVAVYDGDVYAFRDNAGGTAVDLYKATASGWSQVTLSNAITAGARIDHLAYNFTGAVSGKRLYWANGNDRCIEFDGTTDTQLTGTGAPTAPQHLAAAGNRLVLSSAGGQVDLSPVGTPTSSDWTVTGGSINMGDEVTAMIPHVAGALTVLCAERINILNEVAGSLSNASMQEHTSHTGAREWTSQRFTDVLFLDTFGVSSLSATQAYGDFEMNSLSRRVKPLVDYWRPSAAASVVSRRKNQYRLYFPDSDNGVTDVLTGTRVGDSMRWARGKLGFVLTCVTSAEIDGEERLFAGSTSGMVYELDVGSDFDGEEILAILRLPFNHLGTPSALKRFRRIWADVSTPAQFDASLSVEINYADPDTPPSVRMTDELLGGGGMWSVDRWSEFAWSARQLGELEAQLAGSGMNVGIILSSRGDDVPVHTWQSVRIKYTTRAIDR